MQPLIIGLDPGTTTAYAILDSNGEIIKVNSKRNMKLSSILNDVIKYGKPLLVGTDKEKVPKLIKKFSLLTGAKIISPEEDRVVKEKRKAINIKTRNGHEFDALTSAFFAFDKSKNLINRIKVNLKKRDMAELKDEVVSLVFSRGISIHKALNLVQSEIRQ